MQANSKYNLFIFVLSSLRIYASHLFELLMNVIVKKGDLLKILQTS